MAITDFYSPDIVEPPLGIYSTDPNSEPTSSQIRDSVTSSATDLSNLTIALTSQAFSAIVNSSYRLALKGSESVGSGVGRVANMLDTLWRKAGY